jgi:hypothetical protein
MPGLVQASRTCPTCDVEVPQLGYAELRWHPRLAGNKQGVDGRDTPGTKCPGAGHDELTCTARDPALHRVRADHAFFFSPSMIASGVIGMCRTRTPTAL